MSMIDDYLDDLIRSSDADHQAMLLIDERDLLS